MGLNEDFEKNALTHLPAVYRASVAVCGDKHVAEDIAQTTLLKAMSDSALLKGEPIVKLGCCQSCETPG